MTGATATPLLVEVVNPAVLLGGLTIGVVTVDVVEVLAVTDALLDEEFEVFGLPNKLLFCSACDMAVDNRREMKNPRQKLGKLLLQTCFLSPVKYMPN